MLDAGATSSWEEWQVTGTFRHGRWLPRPRSHCHAWSACVTAWLSRHVLGVRPAPNPADGLVVGPNPGGLDRVSGVVPTRYGPVAVSWRVEDGRLAVDIDAPANAAIEFEEPAGFEGRTSVNRRAGGD
jgi:alpha-L-rhamnosidase